MEGRRESFKKEGDPLINKDYFLSHTFFGIVKGRKDSTDKKKKKLCCVAKK